MPGATGGGGEGEGGDGGFGGGGDTIENVTTLLTRTLQEPPLSGFALSSSHAFNIPVGYVAISGYLNCVADMAEVRDF
jgi:hypothetical protein